MNIVVGYDGSNSSKEAIEQAKKQARAFNGRLFVVTSHKPDSVEQEEKSHDIGKLEKEIDALGKAIEEEGLACETHLLITGLNPGEDLILFAENNNIDLFVIGVKKRSKVEKLVFGSTAQYVILNAECPVLTVK